MVHVDVRLTDSIQSNVGNSATYLVQEGNAYSVGSKTQ